MTPKAYVATITKLETTFTLIK